MGSNRFTRVEFHLRREFSAGGGASSASPLLCASSGMESNIRNDKKILAQRRGDAENALMIKENEVSGAVVDAAVRVHQELGPGLVRHTASKSRLMCA